MRRQLRRGDLVKTEDGEVGMVMTYFDPITYQPAMAEVFFSKGPEVIKCQTLTLVQSDQKNENNLKDLKQHQQQ